MPRRNGHACHARDIGTDRREYHRDDTADVIESNFAAAKKVIRARPSAVDATFASRGLGCWPSMEAQMPRGWK
jgi:hypothetical protein